MGKHAETKGRRRYSLPAHPATAPAVITAALVLLVVGLGWLNRGGAPGAERLAVPLASGAEASPGEGGAGDERPADGDDRVVWPWASPEEGGRSLPDGRPFVTENWLDIPLVAPALVLQPSAVGTIIPGVTVAPGTATGTTGLTGSGSGSGTGSSGDGSSSSGDGSTGSGTGTTRPRTGVVSTVTTRGTPSTGVPTTATPTTEPPVTTPPTTEPPVTTPPTTEPPVTTPPTTEPPVTTPPTTAPNGGLLDTVDNLLGGVVGGLGGALGLSAG